MADFFFLLFVLLCGWTLYKVIVDPRRTFEYPYFMGCMFTVFLLPQAMSLKLNPGLATTQSVTAAFLMCFLSLLMAVLGYYCAPSIKISQWLNYNLDLKKLLSIAIAYAIVGAIFLFIMNNSPTEDGGNWSGTLTIYA